MIWFFAVAIRCPSLNTPDHAIQSGNGCGGPNSSYSTSCFFSCMLGYEAVGGSQKRTCLESREWSGTEIQCKRKESVFYVHLWLSNRIAGFQRCRSKKKKRRKKKKKKILLKTDSKSEKRSFFFNCCLFSLTFLLFVFAKYQIFLGYNLSHLINITCSQCEDLPPFVDQRCIYLK